MKTDPIIKNSKKIKEIVKTNVFFFMNNCVSLNIKQLKTSSKRVVKIYAY